MLLKTFNDIITVQVDNTVEGCTHLSTKPKLGSY